jgi:hypothetical protein
MKTLSASIIVFSGCLLFASAYLWHGDSQTVVMLVGSAVILFGMLGWWRELNSRSG